MGLFSGIGNIFKSPFKSIGNIFRGKISLNDILSAGSLLAPGGNFFSAAQKGVGGFALKNLGLQSLLGSSGLPTDWNQIKDGSYFLQNGIGGQGQQPGMMMQPGTMPSNLEAAYRALLGKSYSLANAGLDFKAATDPMRNAFTLAAANELDPSRNMAIAAKVGNQAFKAADRVNAQDTGRLSTLGFSAGDIAGINNDRLNTAQIQANAATEQAFDPITVANQRRAQIATLSTSDIDRQIAELTNSITTLRSQKMQEQQFNASQPTTMDTIMPLLGQWLAMGGADGLLTRGKQTQASSLPQRNYNSTLPATMTLAYNPFKPRDSKSQRMAYDPYAYMSNIGKQ